MKSLFRVYIVLCLPEDYVISVTHLYIKYFIKDYSLILVTRKNTATTSKVNDIICLSTVVLFQQILVMYSLGHLALASN